MAMVSFGSYSEARAHFKDLLDAAGRGRPALVRRDHLGAAVVDAERLRRALAVLAPQVQVVAEDGAWSVCIPGMPVAADGGTFDEAVDEFAEALREYAADWDERLHSAPNHTEHWGVVQLIALSDDEQLRSWITGSTR